jgi:hypothetical protein
MKMKEIVKICKIHGELTIDGARIVKEGKYAFFRCKQCRNITAKKDSLKHVERKTTCSREWKRKNRIKIRAWEKQDRIDNPDKYRKYRRNFDIKYPGMRNIRTIARARGLKPEEYLAFFDKQDHKCAICKNEEIRKTKGKVMRLGLDHCHTTGKNRELLCHNCNTGIGKFFDSVELLQAAIVYLRKHK